MVSKRKLKFLEKKLKPDKNIKLPKIYLKNKQGQLIDTETREIISQKEVEKNKSSNYPDVILVRGKEGGQVGKQK